MKFLEIFSAQIGRINFTEIRHIGFGLQSKHQSLIEQRRHFDNEHPPPLPVKKKHSK